MKALNILLVVVLFSFLSSSYAEENEAQPSLKTKPESLRQALIQGGYKEEDIFDKLNADQFKDFAQFGSPVIAQKFKTGDAFDKIDVKKETNNHRESLAKKNFVLDKLLITIVDIENVETKGLLVEVKVPFRILHSWNEPLNSGSSGVLIERPHPLDAGTSYAFLTNDNQLHPCANLQEATEARSRNKVLYIGESRMSKLVLVIKDDIDSLKQIARNPKNYSVSVELQNLNCNRPKTWGFYKEKALIKVNWDCENLRDSKSNSIGNESPDYFVTNVLELGDNANSSEIVTADISYLRFFDNKKDKIIGDFNPGKDISHPTLPVIETEMVLIPAGKFMMGSPVSEVSRADRETQHEVTLTKPFYMGKYEVTQEQWEAVMGYNLSVTKGANLPVTDVSWSECNYFVYQLNQKIYGKYRIPKDGVYRLPTEAEWEYACRAGTATAYSFGNNITTEDANSSDSKIYKPVKVGSYKPNAFGLYDMHGNVEEWCEDWKAEYQAVAATDPEGPAIGKERVIRGGSFDSNYRCFIRTSTEQYKKATYRGFRLVMTADIKAIVVHQAPKLDLTAVKPVKVNLLVSPFTEAKVKDVQKAVAKSIQKEAEYKADLGKGIIFECVLIPAGKFMMGSPVSEVSRADRETQHEVTLTKPFYMGKYEVTQEQWEAVMGYNLSVTKGANLPVTDVSWYDCQLFIKRLNTKTGSVYRLPTEAEWEYACRAGTATAYSFGNNITTEDANSSDSKIYKPVKVGSYKPNAFGLYDMHGNVEEWCEDWYESYSVDAVTDPKDQLDSTGHYRVIRGGSFAHSDPRSSYRGLFEPAKRDKNHGVRLVSTIK